MLTALPLAGIVQWNTYIHKTIAELEYGVDFDYMITDGDGNAALRIELFCEIKEQMEAIIRI